MQAATSSPFVAMGLGAIQPDYALTPAQYGERVIPLAVYPTMVGGRVGLGPANDCDVGALERVRLALEALAPATARDPSGWAALKVSELLKRIELVPSFKDDDVWCGTIGQQPVLVIKQSSLTERQMTLEEAVRRVHRSLVADAMQRGLPVPSEVAREHKLGEDAGSERDL